MPRVATKHIEDGAVITIHVSDYQRFQFPKGENRLIA